VKTVCTVLALDPCVADELAVMRRQLLRLVHCPEFAPAAVFRVRVAALIATPTPTLALALYSIDPDPDPSPTSCSSFLVLLAPAGKQQCRAADSVCAAAARHQRRVIHDRQLMPIYSALLFASHACCS